MLSRGSLLAGAGWHQHSAHHNAPYATCASPSLDDSAPLCEHDHHELHDNGRTLHLKNGQWIGPDGPVDPPEGQP